MEIKDNIVEQTRELLRGYHQKTLEIRDSLKDMEEEFFTDNLHKLIDEREALIQKIKGLQKKAGLSNLAEIGMGSDFIDTINLLEKEISTKLNAFKDAQGKHISQIKQNKMVHHAYSGYMPFAEGVFIDKKK